MNLTEAADYLHIVSIDPAMQFTPVRRARLGEVEDAIREAIAEGPVSDTGAIIDEALTAALKTVVLGLNERGLDTTELSQMFALGLSAPAVAPEVVAAAVHLIHPDYDLAGYSVLDVLEKLAEHGLKVVQA